MTNTIEPLDILVMCLAGIGGGTVAHAICFRLLPYLAGVLPLPRFMHKIVAKLGGYFWLPCPLCGRMFGGHETGETSYFEWESGGVQWSRACCRLHDVRHVRRVS